jgi:sugar phosphate isomerase/epimerase
VRIAISNIAWRLEEDPSIAAVMAEHGIGGVEIAPTVVWANPTSVAKEDALEYRRWWEDRGVAIVAMQALLYGRPELTIFDTEAERLATLEHLAGISRLAGWLGATRMVFGSPANRKAGHLPPDERLAIATEFFRRAGDAAHAEGVTLCIEPNPPQYGCDFVNSVAEARDLVGRVDSPGFGLHLDAAGMTLQGDLPDVVQGGEPPLHFHISEPFLARLGSSTTDHSGFARALGAVGYDGWCSIEARRPADGPIVDEVAWNLGFAVRTYGSA